MQCQNEDHDLTDQPEAVAVITLQALAEEEGYRGYAVCPPHLMDYVQGVYLDQQSDFRLAFTVEPSP